MYFCESIKFIDIIEYIKRLDKCIDYHVIPCHLINSVKDNNCSIM